MPKLIDLEVDRVDLVDEGANSQAHIMLYKRKEQTTMSQSLSFEEILKKLQPEHAAVVEAEIAKAKSTIPEETATELDNVKKSLKDTKEALENAKAENIAKSKDEEPDFEEVIKGLDPSLQAMFKRMQEEKDAAEQIAKAAAEKQLNDVAIAKAASLKNIPVSNEQLVAVVKGISTEMYDVLKAANDAIENSGVLDEQGSSTEHVEKAGNAEQAWELLEKRAGEIATEQGITPEAAMAIAIKKHRDLYQTYLKGGNQ